MLATTFRVCPIYVLIRGKLSLGMMFCSMVSLTTSYYMLIDHVWLSVGITVLKDGVFYSVLPILGSVLLNDTGMWAAFAAAPLIALALSFLFIRIRFGKARFPYLLDDSSTDIVVIEDTLTPESCAQLSERVDAAIRERGCPQAIAAKAALFAEEIGLTILEKNGVICTHGG